MRALIRQIFPFCFVMFLSFLTACGSHTEDLALENGRDILATAHCNEEKPATCPHAPLPDVQLIDFQPHSSNNDEPYNLDTFTGKPILVALMASWCSYCRSQVGMLEQLKVELRNRGKQVHILAINQIGANETQALLADECTFPLFQDTEEIKAWELFNGDKDDFYIYQSDGTLAIYLPSNGDVSTNLSYGSGYANLRDTLMVVE